MTSEHTDNLEFHFASRRSLLAFATAGMAGGLGSSVLSIEPARAEDEKPMLMFVQIAENLKVDAAAKTVRLINVGQQTLYFADRPVRIAGHLRMADYLQEWTSKAGPDNFGKDPPNAALSVFEPGQTDNTLAIIEIRKPKVEGQDLVYEYKVIDGKLPSTGGQTSLFIDWIGAGGGVGVGFHGAGVGFRGRGFR